VLSAKVPTICDHVIEISVTPNRPDALGHWGIARDLAPKLGREFAANALLNEEPNWRESRVDGNLVEIVAASCARYIGIVVEGVKVGPSDLATRVRLHRLQQRAISNVVDATNLALLGYGQPTHAFDLDRLSEHRVVVRVAHDDEPLVTLDQKSIVCTAQDLVIADAGRAQALAGVMGGAESMVSAETSRLLLEIAYFDPRTVRGSAKRHGFHTDASHRFERGVDHGERLEGAADLLVQEIVGSAGGRPLAHCDVSANRPAVPKIELDPRHVSRLLGVEVAAQESLRYLQGVGVSVDSSNAERWICTPPSGRPDLTRDVDLIEEIMRHRGLHDLPNRHNTPSLDLLPWPRSAVLVRQARLVDALRGLGVHEIISLAFCDAQLPSALMEMPAGARRVALKNPLRVQAGFLRHSLLPGLLEALARNRAHHQRALRLFEQGRVYRWAPTRGSDEARGIVGRPGDETLPDEPLHLDTIWYQPDASAGASTVHQLASAMLGVLRNLGWSCELRPIECPKAQLHPGVGASIFAAVGDAWRNVGFVGEIHPDLTAHYQLDGCGPIAYAHFELEHLVAWQMQAPLEIPRFPATSRDLALEMPLDMSAISAISALRAAASDVEGEIRLVVGDASIHAIEVLDDYRGAGLGENRKSLLFRLYYRSPARNVTDQEVQAVHDSIVSAACASLTQSSGMSVHPR
jgi:phenylalanyl-tRNA synthetase beta chain